MICKRICPEKYPWNQRVTRPEISGTKQVPYLLFKLKIFSQVFATSNLGIKPTSWVASSWATWLPGQPQRSCHKCSQQRPLAIMSGSPAAGEQPSYWDQLNEDPVILLHWSAQSGSLWTELGCHIPFFYPNLFEDFFLCPKLTFETLDSRKKASVLPSMLRQNTWHFEGPL